MNWLATTAAPLKVSVPCAGKLLILTASRLFVGVSFGSVKPKAAALKTYGVSSLVVTVLLNPIGASLTAVTVILLLAVAELNAVLPPFSGITYAICRLST